jgi:hypothetical protein
MLEDAADLAMGAARWARDTPAGQAATTLASAGAASGLLLAMLL